MAAIGGGEKEKAYLCPARADGHHYHSDRQQYVGSCYLALCCHCGRVQTIIYHGRRETPDLVWIGGSECGQFFRS